MQNIPRTNQVTESHRATLRAKYLGNSGRITVSRYESNTHGRDPQKVTVSWNYALDPSENYAEAVRQYVTRANWSGHWITSTITDGAVAVYAGEIDQPNYSFTAGQRYTRGAK